MEHTYTNTHIIRFLYNECDLFEKLEMEFAMEEDCTLRGKYLHLKKSFDSLPKVTFSPKKSSIDAVLAYSKKSIAAHC